VFIWQQQAEFALHVGGRYRKSRCGGIGRSTDNCLRSKPWAAMAAFGESCRRSGHVLMSLTVKGFGRRPIAALPLALGPSSESLQRRNPRVRTGRCSALWGFEVWDGAAGDGWWGIAAGVEADVGVIGSAADAFLGCGRRGMQGLGAVGRAPAWPANDQRGAQGAMPEAAVVVMRCRS
jgi:hypothetical protein